ncbi:MAG: ABC transporter permease [Anaerolineales bacterium]|nr:ABC transporter permease [Anaerolineales bacterium]
MRAFGKLTLVQAKLYLREPIGAFFTMLFAPLVLVLFAFIYGNEPTDLFGGRGSVDVSVPSYVGMIIGSVGLMSVPIATAAAREKGVLRRYRVTPLRPTTYLLADVCVNFAMALVGIALLFVVGKLGYSVRFDGRPLDVLAAVCLASAAFLALGYLLASVAPSARVAQVVGMVLLYPMMFLSGASIPLEIMPENVRAVSRYLPLTHVVTLIKGLWFGEPWNAHITEVVVLVAILALGVIASSRLFRWE